MAPPERIAFRALEYDRDDAFHGVEFTFEGSVQGGWRIERAGSLYLELGPGYRLLRTELCGVCSTDLARRFLPFPLPQITGHELVASDPREQGEQRYVVEINASHQARGLSVDCPFCNSGLDTHCPERLVLGIHALPGGFGPWVLVPTHAVLPLPDALPSAAAVLVEPFAAALHGARRAHPRHGESFGVLGPRRLGLLCVAALAAEARRRGITLDLVALSRHPALLELAERFGANRGELVRGAGEHLGEALFDVVFDTTGSPSGLELAIRLARREVHLKSTHGEETVGLAHLTELVVDELSIEPLPTRLDALRARPFFREAPTPKTARPRVAWLVEADPPAWLIVAVEITRAPNARAAVGHFAAADPLVSALAPLPRADAAVVASAADVDAVIRPRTGSEESLLRPRGAVLLHASTETSSSPLLAACVHRGLVLSSSRCGDFGAALELLAEDKQLANSISKLVTHHFEAHELPHAFEVARSNACIKALIHHAATEPQVFSSRGSAS